ncbi:hypothetical protein N431DRAFT_437689 [Stipitochalara longipes BDJ]|nr:hypothetical protein N431DRAFT_437689 [Stipitochalara longipes BDJ]
MHFSHKLIRSISNISGRRELTLLSNIHSAFSCSSEDGKHNSFVAIPTIFDTGHQS